MEGGGRLAVPFFVAYGLKVGQALPYFRWAHPPGAPLKLYISDAN